ncbi:TIGR03557 family F420-dependent LLM class oxidoreductase [Kribbella sp. NPDC056861]|uniref:TIGR03557 family F420-dependent LLM class oxidoreductase n=1 Tax=Kribbella sp. NPDC056861 TaxID=3154857 RepID=UPI003432D50E
MLSDGRFTLEIGSGERLNEHIVGKGWPAVAQRHEMLRESLEIIRLLWSGGYQSYEGKHLRLEDARVFDLPDPLPRIAVAAGGPAAARIAGELGDALFVTEPRADLIAEYEKAGGQGPRYAEVPLAWAPSVGEAAESARRLFRFGVTGSKVQSELPNPVNSDAATKLVTADHMAEQLACGPDVERHVEVAREWSVR